MYAERDCAQSRHRGAADGKVRTFLVPLRANRELAMYYRQRGDLDRMKPYMEFALRANSLDVDMCRLYLDHRTGLARVLNDQTVDLRTNRVREEDRPDGRYRTTTTPSAADYERAK